RHRARRRAGGRARLRRGRARRVDDRPRSRCQGRAGVRDSRSTRDLCDLTLGRDRRRAVRTDDGRRARSDALPGARGLMAARRVVPWVALAVVLLAVAVVLAWPGGARSAAERARDLETELRCPECQGLSVADSQAPTSRA